MNTRMICALMTALIFVGLPTWAAPDLQKAEQLANGLCIACHGPQGRSINPAWPNLYGQKDVYMMDQIRLFKSGVRKNELMSPIAATLSDEDSANLAAYFSQFGQSSAELPAIPPTEPAAVPGTSGK